MALALGMVLGDGVLARRALFTNTAGFAIALLTATLLGLFLNADPATPEIASRTEVTLWDLLLALAAGCAGALAYTSGVATYLTGVMVAVALLPPAVASGILLAEGQYVGAVAAIFLALVNVTAVILAAMLTFLWRGMRPRRWWREEHARQTAQRGVALLATLLAVLAALILTAERFLSP